MSRSKDGSDQLTPDLGAATAGILALLIDTRERAFADEKGATRTELLLANAGMSLEEICAVTGKKYDAVRSAIRRARAK